MQSPAATRRVRIRTAACFALAAFGGLLGFGACVSDRVPIRSQQLEYAGCDESERAAIAAAFDRAADLTQRTLAALRDPARHELARKRAWTAYQVWFGDYSPTRYDRIEAVFQAADQEFEHPYAMRCGDRSANCPRDDAGASNEQEIDDAHGPAYEGDWDPGRSWKTFAFTNSGVRAMQFCRDFFDEGRRQRAAVVLHELTHIVRDTEDYAYRESAVLDLAASDPDRAAHNAPNYAAFAADVVFGHGPGEGISVPEPMD